MTTQMALSSTGIGAGMAGIQDDTELALECRSALWKKAFDDATAAGLNPGAVPVTFVTGEARRRDEGGQAVISGVEQYQPAHDVPAFPVRYECRVDPATKAVTSVTYVAVDGDGEDVARSPVQLVQEGRKLAACIDRIESGLEDDVRKRGGGSTRAEVEISPAEVEFVGKGSTSDVQGRGRARYGAAYDWQVLVFTCRYDEKKRQATRSTHALETPSPADALPATSREALDACRLAVEGAILDDAQTRGYRNLRRVLVELPELATITQRANLVDVTGKGEFRLDEIRHQQPTPMSFRCTYDARAGDVLRATFEVERGAWTPSGEIADGPTATLRCGRPGNVRQECPAAIRRNVRIVREFGSARCESYRNWMWSNSQIVVWGGCAAEFEYETR